ncbi:MAG: hypothetical protein SPL30_04940 [Succinivibrio sp.]|nr:hypothetical protein [Succinivibrio sp.]
MTATKLFKAAASAASVGSALFLLVSDAEARNFDAYYGSHYQGTPLDDLMVDTAEFVIEKFSHALSHALLWFGIPAGGLMLLAAPVSSYQIRRRIKAVWMLIFKTGAILLLLKWVWSEAIKRGLCGG